MRLLVDFLGTQEFVPSPLLSLPRFPSCDPTYLSSRFNFLMVLLLPQGKAGKRQEEAAEWLRLAGGKAKSAQDRAEKARVDASSWLRDKGERALSLQGRDQAGRSECAVWLRHMGGRAKSAQARADNARGEAASWLRNSGCRALSVQERTEAARSDAGAWLATKGALELERTASIEGSAGAAPTLPTTGPAAEPTAATEAATKTESEEILASERRMQCDSSGPDDRLDQDTAEASTARGDSGPGPSTVFISPLLDGPSNHMTLRDAEAEAASKDNVRQTPRNDEPTSPTHLSAGEHLTGNKGDNLVATTDAPPPPDQRKSSTECRIDATATAAADAASNFEHPIGHTASSDRTAPAPWLEPVTMTLPRGGSLAPTAACADDFGRMLDVGETEWSRVSLSRTPPFDALNSPSLPLRYAPVRGRRPLPPADVEGSNVVNSVLPDGKEGPPAPVTGVASNAAEDSGWVEFFAPPNQMAPKGDAYQGSDSFHSGDASASTTIRAGSTGSFVGPSSNCASGGTDDFYRPRRRNDGDGDCDGNGDGKHDNVHDNVHDSDRAWRYSVGGGTSMESWEGSLREVQSPVGEAQCRMMEQEGEEGGRWGELTGSLASSLRKVQGDGRSGGGRRLWHKKAEQSRRYKQRWEEFLSRAHQHFDGEVSRFC